MCVTERDITTCVRKGEGNVAYILFYKLTFINFAATLLSTGADKFSSNKIIYRILNIMRVNAELCSSDLSVLFIKLFQIGNDIYTL